MTNEEIEHVIWEWHSFCKQHEINEYNMCDDVVKQFVKKFQRKYEKENKKDINNQ